MRVSLGKLPVIWGVATVHTLGFVLFVAAMCHAAESSFQPQVMHDPGVSFAVFLLLWFTTWWTTRFWFEAEANDQEERSRLERVTHFVSDATVLGGANGALFFLGLWSAGFAAAVLLVALGPVAGARLIRLVVASAFVLFIGMFVAFLTGSLTGLAFALIDVLLWALAYRVFPATQRWNIIASATELPAEVAVHSALQVERHCAWLVDGTGRVRWRRIFFLLAGLIWVLTAVLLIPTAQLVGQDLACCAAG